MLPALIKCKLDTCEIEANRMMWYILYFSLPPSPISLISWKMIGLCWLQDPQQRPKFIELTSKLLNILDSDSSYLRL